MIEERLKKTAILTGMFVIVSLGVMFYRIATRSVIIAEAGDTAEVSGGNISQIELALQKASSDQQKDTLIIPLESGITSENIKYEDKQEEHRFVLYIKGVSPDFYRNNSIVTDLDCIETATLVPLYDKGMVSLVFQLDGLYENEAALGDGEIILSFTEPDYENENAVVIDPVDEFGAALIPYLKKAFGKDDNIKLYFTNTDGNHSDDEAMALIDDAHADFYIQLGSDDAVESDSGIRTYYNDIFFIRGFGNVSFADTLERNIAIAAGGKALGLSAAGDDNTMLSTSVIPSAFVTLGNIKNRVDMENLEKDRYMEKCAQGLAEGIRASFDARNPVTDDGNPDDQTTDK